MTWQDENNEEDKGKEVKVEETKVGGLSTRDPLVRAQHWPSTASLSPPHTPTRATDVIASPFPLPPILAFVSPFLFLPILHFGSFSGRAFLRLFHLLLVLLFMYLGEASSPSCQPPLPLLSALRLLREEREAHLYCVLSFPASFSVSASGGAEGVCDSPAPHKGTPRHHHLKGLVTRDPSRRRRKPGHANETPSSSATLEAARLMDAV